jgi:phosphoglycolate phosphatase-like HAD superfamily hydrolase
MRHVVWDWNGTLFDDQHLVLEGLNAVLRDAGLPPADLDTYRRLYTRPVRRFYERLFGRAIGDEEWEHLEEIYHVTYRDGLTRATLAHDAEVALRASRQTGRSQSLLSMWRHRELVPLVAELGIEEHFVRVDGLGVDGSGQLAGGRKAPYLEAHLRRVVHAAGDDASRVLVVGDAIDDAEAAAHVGARCVLYDGGSHPREELESAGVPVASSLTEALERGGIE